MYYIFIINGREDKRFIQDEINTQLSQIRIDHELYITTGVGDATRFVRIYCDLHRNDEACFVACGGSGTLSEVVSGMIGFENKSVAFMAYGSANNLICYFPGRDFHSLADMVEGEIVDSDVIKCNNEYSINVANFGFDSMSAYYGDLYVQKGKKRPYLLGTLRALLFSRFNNFNIVVDGEKMSKGLTMLCAVANSKYYGDDYKCAPDALIDDGYADVVVARFCPLLAFGLMFGKFKDGTYVNSKFCRIFFKFRKARHVEASSNGLIYMCVDGESSVSRHFTLDVIEHAVKLRIPKL